MIQLLCVEDDPLVRAYLVKLLEAEADIHVVSAVPDTNRALIYLRQHEIDVILLDYQLQGVESTPLLRSMAPWQRWSEQQEHRPAVLFCTGFADKDLYSKARILGARGVVAKERMAHELIQAIHAVAQGGLWYPDACELTSA